jgi:hypothetical protein
MRLRGIGDDARQSGFSRTGRTVKNNARKLVDLNGAAKEP